MQRVTSIEAADHIGETVKLAGWMHNWRDMGQFGFLVLRDGAGTFQAVVSDPDEIARLRPLQFESVLEIEGPVVAEPRAPSGAEMHDVRINVLSPVTDVLPFEINKRELKAGLDVFLSNAPVGLRNLQKRALFRISAQIMAGYREYLSNNGFVEIQTPKIVGSATESGANVFAIDYFGRPAYLAQSPQFYKQIMVGVFERVFEIGPVFRAEKHSTSRHTNEYVSLDFEMGFITDHRDVMAMLTGAMQHIVQRISSHCAGQLEMLKVELPAVEDSIPSLRMRDAQQLIYERHHDDCRQEPDLSPQHETWLCDYAKEEYGSDFLFVTHYPTAKRPFYTMPDDQDPEVTKGFDLLFRGCEIVTGGQRIHRYGQLLDNAHQWKINPDSIAGYLQAFKYGMPPHGGCAIGLERLLMLLTGLKNLRETTLFPRDLDRLSP
jgi:nondiscriminating aspartyl-tRNA synthetase